MFYITVFSVLCVIFVNGFTDAPNAIATAVATKALKLKTAVILCAVFNFLGAFFSAVFNSNVAVTVFSVSNFGNDFKKANIALCAAMISIILWGIFAWFFGIPTSESHALLSGISGAALAVSGGSINIEIWKEIILWLFLSSFLGFAVGFSLTYIFSYFLRNKKSDSVFKKAQIVSSSIMAFSHGAQDGLKFMGIFMLSLSLKNASFSESFKIPLWLILLCSIIISLGTSFGGKRIIKKVGYEMASYDNASAFFSDLSASFCLLFASYFGIPLSTTQVKTMSVAGAAFSKGKDKINYKTIFEMLLAWALTFPVCAIISYLFSKLLIKIFAM